MTASIAETAQPGSRLAVSAIFYANGLAAGSWSILVPHIIRRTGITESDMGLVILAGGATGFLGLIASAALIARFGSRAVCMASGILLAPALPFLALAPSFAFAILAFVWLFLCLSVMDVAMNANGAVVERKASKPIMSAFHGCWSAGAMTGSGLGGFLIAGAGALGQTMIAGGVALAVVLALGPRLDWEKAAPGPLLGSGLARDRRVWVLGVFSLLAFVSEGAVIDWSSLYLRQELAASVEFSGFAFAGFALTMMVGRFTGDALRRRMGAVRLIRVSAGLAVAGYLIAGTAPVLPVAVVGFLLAGIGCSNLVPVAFSAAAKIPGVPAGAGIATATILGYAGLLTAPAALGHVGEVTGFGPVFAAFAGGMAVIFLLAPVTRPAD